MILGCQSQDGLVSDIAGPFHMGCCLVIIVIVYRTLGMVKVVIGFLSFGQFFY